MRGVVFALMLAAAPMIHATPPAVIWTGTLTNYTEADPTSPLLAANQDQITSDVWLTRGTSQGIFNAFSESSYSKPSSPADTEWAVGSIADATNGTLTYGTWYDAGGGNPALNLVGVQLVLHLITDNIYLSVEFTALGSGHEGGSGFSYTRSTPDVVLPTIWNGPLITYN